MVFRPASECMTDDDLPWAGLGEPLVIGLARSNRRSRALPRSNAAPALIEPRAAGINQQSDKSRQAIDGPPALPKWPPLPPDGGQNALNLFCPATDLIMRG